MPAVRHVSAKDGDTLLLVGTMKGVFLLRSSAPRTRWEVGGPYFPGVPVYALAFDKREGRRRIWAGTQSWRWGTALFESHDRGRSRVERPASATTVREALDFLWALYPGVRDRVVNEQGQVREHINIFVGDENIRFTGGLSTAVKDDNEISIVPAVSGGT